MLIHTFIFKTLVKNTCHQESWVIAANTKHSLDLRIPCDIEMDQQAALLSNSWIVNLLK